MSEIQIIQSALETASRRRRWERALCGLWRGLFAGTVLWLAALAVFKLAPVSSMILLWAGVASLVLPLVGFVVGGWRKPVLTETARWVDVKQNLKERMSTALEVARSQTAGAWRDLVVTDAASHAKEIDSRRLVPIHLPKIARWALVVLALTAGLGFVPEYRSKAFIQKQADAKNIKETGKQLADLTRRSLETRRPALETTQRSMEAVTTLGDQLTKQTLTRSDALKDLASVTDKLQDQLKELGKDPALKRMEQAARAPGGESGQTAAGLQKQIESLQKSLGEQSGNPEAMDNLQKDLEKLQAAAKAMANNSSSGDDANRDKLSQSLSSLSKQAQELGLNLPQLDEAISALAANQTDLFLKDLQAAAQDLEKLREMTKTLQQLQAQAEKLGKDLAEQLKNGQAEAAQSTLEKLAEQMKAANLLPEQLQKIMDEVSKALGPSSPYGKVPDYLKDAMKQMQSGQKSEASQSLAAAAKELADLMQQMADAQSLADTLDSLKTASMCIGTGKCWGLCKGMGRPGFKPGGRPGKGVGTWGDDDGYQSWNGENTGLWDNSGINRPDVDPHGHTDRGEGEVTDALTPTKVKGQFSPGGPMPSITLKGVSIKGQSKVAYEEAATTAQSEAQAALSQDKVPRAYQGAVREYFDDLKK